MKVVIAGAGEVGFHIAQRLSKEGHHVTVVDKDAAKERFLQAKLNAMIVPGSGASARALEEAGIHEADLFIAVTDRDEVNLLACLLAHESGCRRLIARAKSLEYSTAEWAHNARKIGIDLLINPQNVVAEDICRIVSYPAASEAAEFADGRAVFLGYRIHRGSPLAGIKMRDVAGVRGIYRMVVTAIARRDGTIIPRGDDAIQEGDDVYFVCNKRDVPAIDYLFGVERKSTRTVFILGGGPIGEAVARKLADLKMRVKVIDGDAAVCQRLAQDLDGVDVIHAEGTDVDVLKGEAIADCDAYVAVTPDEQTNILCSLLGKSHGAKRAIALVDRHELVTLSPTLGVDACISPRLATASAILRYVRPTSVASMAIIARTNAEVLEIVLPAESPILKRPLKEIGVPAGAIIGLIVRGQEAVIPDGEDRLEPGDHAIVFTLPEVLTRIERFFS